ncbi:hypothetical protein BKA69DRAFT_674060 [Paraphysoderma sedebokerense]|nr:hypothetical protein BKA69DRAFT_674060 [Paraphysoderma sedebokerense]
MLIRFMDLSECIIGSNTNRVVRCPYDMWVSFNSIPYKPRVKVPGILALQLQLVSVHPVNGSTEGFNITLITSDIGIVQQDEVNVSVGGISCFNTNQLNSTAFSCTVPPATGKNKLVVINIGSNATSSELVYIHYNPPVITDISPPSSPTTGGRMIYIS